MYLTGQKDTFGRYIFTDNLTAALVLTAGTPTTDSTDAREQRSQSATGTIVTKAHRRDRAAACAGVGHTDEEQFASCNAKLPHQVREFTTRPAARGPAHRLEN